MDAQETPLGEITCPSGVLTILDGGYLGSWSADRSPQDVDPETLGLQDPRLAAEIASAVDFEVIGPDADAAARSFNQWAGLTLYDIPASKTQAFTAKFAEHCRERGLEAGLAPFPQQIAHRHRARRAAGRNGAGAFPFFGVSAVAVGGLPGDRPLAVSGTRSLSASFEDRWSSLTLHVHDAPAVRSVEVGVVGVDWARLMFADVDALSSWQREHSIDGLADVAFWGRDADQAATALDAPMLGTVGEDNVQGWRNLAYDDAFQRAMEVGSWKAADPARRLAFDFRPHSHHWQAMAGVRAADTEASTVDVGGARMLMAMTSWGDGMFPVHADFGEHGDVVRVRVAFDTEIGE